MLRFLAGLEGRNKRGTVMSDGRHLYSFGVKLAWHGDKETVNVQPAFIETCGQMDHRGLLMGLAFAVGRNVCLEQQQTGKGLVGGKLGCKLSRKQMRQYARDRTPGDLRSVEDWDPPGRPPTRHELELTRMDKEAKYRDGRKLRKLQKERRAKEKGRLNRQAKRPLDKQETHIQ